MNAEKLKKYRSASLILFFLGLVSFFYTFSQERNNLFLFSGLVTYSGLSYFLFTESFLYPRPKRSLFSIWIARIFLFSCILIITNILFGLARRMFWAMRLTSQSRSHAKGACWDRQTAAAPYWNVRVKYGIYLSKMRRKPEAQADEVLLLLFK